MAARPPASPLERPLRIITTPATVHTGEVGIAVRVSSDSSKLPRLPTLGTTYQAADICKTRMAEFKNYICTDIGGEGEYIWIYFSKNKTAAQASEAFKKPSTKDGNLFWHPTLLKVDVVRMKMPRAVNVGDRVVIGYSYQAIPTYHPSMDTGTLFTLTQYLTPEEPEIQQWPTPQVSAVSFPLPGGERPFSFPECYHGQIDIDIMQEVAEVYHVVGSGTTSQVGNQGPFSFKATDPPFPASYVLYERPVKLATGAWLTDRMLVSPPNLSPAITG